MTNHWSSASASTTCPPAHIQNNSFVDSHKPDTVIAVTVLVTVQPALSRARRCDNDATLGARGLALVESSRRRRLFSHPRAIQRRPVSRWLFPSQGYFMSFDDFSELACLGFTVRVTLIE